MIELGVKQKLYIDHKTDFGVYLSDTPERNGKSDCVLLPKKQVPQNAKIGDEVEVFVQQQEDIFKVKYIKPDGEIAALVEMTLKTIED